MIYGKTGQEYLFEFCILESIQKHLIQISKQYLGKKKLYSENMRITRKESRIAK